MGNVGHLPLTFFRSFLLLCAGLLVASSLRAQSTTDGAIGGTITDASGAAVVGANVTVTSNTTSLAQQTTTDETGYYRVAKLQPAVYTI
jgi:hypothetical protein